MSNWSAVSRATAGPRCCWVDSCLHPFNESRFVERAGGTSDHHGHGFVAIGVVGGFGPAGLVPFCQFDHGKERDPFVAVGERVVANEPLAEYPYLAGQANAEKRGNGWPVVR